MPKTASSFFVVCLKTVAFDADVRRKLMSKTKYSYLWNNLYVRVSVPAVLCIVLFSLVIFQFLAPEIKEQLIGRETVMVTELVNAAWSIVAMYKQQEDSGELTRQAAQQRAIGHIRNMRYGADMKGYFWIQDIYPRMIMHPYRSDLEGQDISNVRDSSGRAFWVDAVHAVQKNGSGFIEYRRDSNKNPSMKVSKLSYVKRFEPWGWIIGSGIYIDAVKNEFSRTLNKLFLIALVILGITSTLLFFIIWQAMRSEKQRKNAEKALAKSEKKYRDLVQNANSIVLWLDRQGNILFFNEFAETFFEYSAIEIIGKNIVGTIVPEFDAAGNDLRAIISDFRENHEQFSVYEHENITKSGKRVWVSWANKVLYDEQGAPREILSVGTDVTSSKQAENALRASEAKYRTLAENINIGVFRSVLDIQGSLLYANQALAKMYGSDSVDELLHLPVSQFYLNPDDRALVLNELASHGFLRNKELPLKKKNGENIWCSISASLVYDGDHSPKWVDGVIEDISDRKLAEKALRESEERFRALVEQAPEAILVYDLDLNRFVDANTNAERLFGCGRDELLAAGPQRFYPPDQPDGRQSDESFSEHNAQALKGEKVVFERLILNARGGEYFCEVRLVRLPSADRRLLRVSFIDITERKRTEEALGENEQKLRNIINNSSDGIYLQNEQGRIIEWNPRMAEITMISHDRAVGSFAWDLNYSLSPNETQNENLYEQIKARGLELLNTNNIEMNLSEHLIQCADGTRRIIEGNPFCIHSSKGNLLGATVRDITERMKAEADLRESEQRLQDLISFLPDATFVIDLEKKIRVWNKATEKMTGVKAEHMLGRGDYEYALPFYGERSPILIDLVLEPQDAIEKRYTGLSRHEDVLVGESFIPTFREGGAYLWGIAKPLYDAAGTVIGVIESIRDITDRRRAEDSMRESEKKYRDLVETANSIILRMKMDGTILYINSFGYNFFGYTEKELIGASILNTLIPQDTIHARGNITEMIDEISKGSAKSLSRDIECIKRNGERGWISFTAKLICDDLGNPVEFLCIGNDMTERRMIQQETMRAAHLASIGELAAGVAHEINNPITGIINYGGLLCEGCDDMRETLDIAERIIKEGERIGAIVNKLLSFAREDDTEPVPCSVEEIFSDAYALMQKRYMQSGIIVNKQFPPGLPKVIVNHQKIEQVFVNCLSNARDALNAKYISSDRNKILEVSAEAGMMNYKPSIRLLLHDHGIGIPESIMEKICNPFFTTKPAGKGTGLGLSITHNIIKDYGGRLLFESREGEYTKVIIDLPAEPLRRYKL